MQPKQEHNESVAHRHEQGGDWERQSTIDNGPGQSKAKTDQLEYRRDPARRPKAQVHLHIVQRIRFESGAHPAR